VNSTNPAKYFYIVIASDQRERGNLAGTEEITSSLRFSQ